MRDNAEPGISNGRQLVGSSVARAVVNDDHFQIHSPLRKGGLESASEQRPPVASWYDDRYDWRALRQAHAHARPCSLLDRPYDRRLHDSATGDGLALVVEPGQQLKAQHIL